MNDYQAKETKFFNIPLESTVIKCPTCKDLGMVSEVRLIGITAPFQTDEFWDQQGRFHKHNLEPHKATFRCTNEHAFSIEEREECWCETQNKKEQEYQDALKFFGLEEPINMNQLIEVWKECVKIDTSDLPEKYYSILAGKIYGRQ